MTIDTAKLNGDLVAFINKLTLFGDSLEEKINVSLAISLFAGKQVSLVRAAELSNKSLTDFMGILRSINIPWGEYTEDSES